MKGGTGYLHFTPDGKYVTVASGRGDPEKDLLVDVFADGEVLKDYKIGDIRKRADVPNGPFIDLPEEPEEPEPVKQVPAEPQARVLVPGQGMARSVVAPTYISNMPLQRFPYMPGQGVVMMPPGAAKVGTVIQHPSFVAAPQVNRPSFVAAPPAAPGQPGQPVARPAMPQMAPNFVNAPRVVAARPSYVAGPMTTTGQIPLQATMRPGVIMNAGTIPQRSASVGFGMGNVVQRAN